jgi:trk system potassium uptake protein TrkA
MHILIAGVGALGRQVAESLVELRHDVVAIDVSKAACEAVYAELGVVAVHGSATDVHVLEEAGARKADVVVTTMHSDAENITAVLLAHSLGVERTVARLQDPSYEDAYNAAGVTHVVRATRLLHNQIILHLQHPKVHQIVTLEDHDVEMFSVDIPTGAKCSGMQISQLASSRGFPRQCLIAGLFRSGHKGMTIPRGDDVLRSGDSVYVFARNDDVERVVGLLTKA